VRTHHKFQEFFFHQNSGQYFENQLEYVYGGKENKEKIPKVKELQLFGRIYNNMISLLGHLIESAE